MSRCDAPYFVLSSLDTVTTNAEQFATAFHDELHRVIIHGILHLCGLKDETEEEEKEMRRAEDEVLGKL